MAQAQTGGNTSVFAVASTATSEKDHFAKSHVYPRKAAGFVGAVHIVLTVGLVVDGVEDSWRGGKPPSEVYFGLALFAITGLTQIFTAFYPGSITVGCLLGLACFSAVGDVVLLSAVRDLSWWLAAVESLVILVTFVIACRALCCRRRNKFTAIPADVSRPVYIRR